MSICATIGRPIIVGIDACIHDGFVLFDRHPSIDARFLVHHLSAMEPFFISQGQTGTQANLNTGIVRASPLSLPPLPEQRAIAAVLDAIDDSIRKTEQIIAKLQQVKQGLLHDLLTRGIDDNGELRDPERHPEQFQDSPLGRIPKGWEVTAIGKQAGMVTNGFVGVATPFYSKAPDAVPYLYGRNIRANRIDLSSHDRVSRAFHLGHRKSQLRPGDLLTVQSGHIGTSAVVPRGFSEANCHALIITRLLPHGMLPEFVARYLNSEVGMRRLSSIFVGSTILHINTSELARFELPHPAHRTEQELIVLRLDDIDHVIDIEAANVESLRRTKSGLAEDLLTGRVRTTALGEISA